MVIVNIFICIIIFIIISTLFQPYSCVIKVSRRAWLPVILRPEDEAGWLNKESDKGSILDLLSPYASDEMRAYKVDSAVGNVRNNTDEELIKAVS
ncbi:SOS response-associated peptidase family protein [Paenibacillus sp. Z3-2]